MSQQRQERVEKGAEWLDNQWPGWEKVIDRKTLELSSSCNCVLGQLYNREAKANSPSIFMRDGFSYARSTYVPDRNTTGLGFDDSRDGYRELNKLWQEQIEKRLEEKQ